MRMNNIMFSTNMVTQGLTWALAGTATHEVPISDVSVCCEEKNDFKMSPVCFFEHLSLSLMSSFLTLSILVTPNENLTIQHLRLHLLSNHR